jgi:ribosomal protein S18 acetylase RimI-like enzyme
MPPSKLSIRPFAIADTEAVVQLWHDCELTRPWNDPYRDIARKLTVQPELFLVGEIDGTVVASAMAGYDGHRGWINYLSVAPAHRRQGHARALVLAAERALVALGCPKINLQIRGGNTAVTALYERMGFRNDDTVCMGKRLIPDGPDPRDA